MAHPYKSSRVLARAIVAELNEVPIGVHGHLIKPAETGPASVTWPDCHAEFVQYIEDKWPALSDQASLTAAFIEKFCVEGSVVDQSNARPATLDTGRYGVGVLYPLRLCFSLYSADDKQAYRCVEEAPLIASYLGPTPRPGGLFELVHEPILVDSDLGPGTEVVVLTAIMAALEIGLPAGITWAVDHETVLLPTDLGASLSKDYLKYLLDRGGSVGGFEVLGWSWATKLHWAQLIWDQITSEQYRGEITRIAQEAKPHLVRLYHAHTNPENVNEMRRSCKTLSFGALYGAVAGGLHPLVRLGKRC